MIRLRVRLVSWFGFRMIDRFEFGMINRFGFGDDKPVWAQDGTPVWARYTLAPCRPLSLDHGKLVWWLDGKPWAWECKVPASSGKLVLEMVDGKVLVNNEVSRWLTYKAVPVHVRNLS